MAEDGEAGVGNADGAGERPAGAGEKQEQEQIARLPRVWVCASASCRASNAFFRARLLRRPLLSAALNVRFLSFHAI